MPDAIIRAEVEALVEGQGVTEHTALRELLRRTERELLKYQEADDHWSYITERHRRLQLEEMAREVGLLPPAATTALARC